MNEWWQSRQARERRTLAIGAAIVAAMVYYFLLWQPAHQGIQAKEQRLAQLRNDVAWMEQAGARYQKLADRGDTASSGAGNEALYALADRTAREAGLGDAIQGVTPEQDNRVRVNLSGVGFDAMVQWLATLRRDFQVRTATASVERIAEPGQVNARLVLSRGQQ